MLTFQTERREVSERLVVTRQVGLRCENRSAIPWNTEIPLDPKDKVYKRFRSIRALLDAFSVLPMSMRMRIEWNGEDIESSEQLSRVAAAGDMEPTIKLPCI